MAKTDVVQFGVLSASFRLSGTKLETLYQSRWLEVWKIGIVQNNKDLAIDYDKQKQITTVTTRDKHRLNGINRMVFDEDIVLFDLENGKSLVMAMTSEVKKMLTLLRKRGVRTGVIDADADITRIP